MDVICLETPFRGERDCFHYLYKITSLIPEKPYYYIGRFSTLKAPETDNYYGSGTSKWQRILSKYGKSSFKKEILQFHQTFSELLKAEEEAVSDLYIKDEWCCNLCKGGLGTFGYKFSEETKRKISQSNRGKRMGDENPSKRPEVREKISKGLQGRVYSKETREKLRQSKVGKVSYYPSEEQKVQNSLRQREQYRDSRIPARGMLNKVHSLETKFKISEANSGRPMGETTRLAIRKSRLGVPNPASEETKLKISKANKGRLWSEEQKKRASELAKKRGQRVSVRTESCIYCGRVCSIGNYKRWHGENCKQNNI